MNGCAVSQPTKIVRQTPTCHEAVSSGLIGLTDEEVNDLLDHARSDGNISACWVPLFTACLEQDRPISRDHLIFAVKTFNKKIERERFHRAICRYFIGISDDAAVYRSEDRQLLKAYCSYLIQSAENSQDIKLRDIKLICRNLDRDLYSRFFE
ncbi:hypothetical protein DSCO28_65860 [Desulfosarcina ovata subsp. sediminis]|uniref:Uncharacterized protein n=2 Tax=Desulfosarcina ovata TaxID=83564 RepID=A0A5K8A122_9BACT|nr:hypothetical protein [Desulfosarcina ovata]BBO86020.1 hypothetical protein DSCO28_65860 [Desulfosarcina ovata subsp. sediminis]